MYTQSDTFNTGQVKLVSGVESLQIYAATSQSLHIVGTVCEAAMEDLEACAKLRYLWVINYYVLNIYVQGCPLWGRMGSPHAEI